MKYRMEPSVSKLIEGLYLDYFNNFLTVPRFAEYYGMDDVCAAWVIEKGREINHEKCK